MKKGKTIAKGNWELQEKPKSGWGPFIGLLFVLMMIGIACDAAGCFPQ